MRLAQVLGCADALVGARRRHPDVGEHDIRQLRLDGGEQRVEVAAGSNDLDVGARLEQAPRALAHEIVVFGEHDAERHPSKLRTTQAMTSPVVLIVDDNDLNRKLVRDVLRAAGLDTLEAATGEDAIRLVRQELPDLVLMDIRLPDLDGTAALRRLEAEPATARIPVIALTALGGAGDVLRDAGFDDCLEKPIDAVALPGQVRNFIGRPREAGTPGAREGGTLDDPHCA